MDQKEVVERKILVHMDHILNINSRAAIPVLNDRNQYHIFAVPYTYCRKKMRQMQGTRFAIKIHGNVIVDVAHTIDELE